MSAELFGEPMVTLIGLIVIEAFAVLPKASVTTTFTLAPLAIEAAV
jgi:hypothetical protein